MKPKKYFIVQKSPKGKEQKTVMESMIREYLTTILRNLLGPVVAYLAATGYISESEATNLVVAVVAIAISVVWGLGNKYVWKQKVDTALELPAGSSPAKLNDVIANK